MRSFWIKRLAVLALAALLMTTIPIWVPAAQAEAAASAVQGDGLLAQDAEPGLVEAQNAAAAGPEPVILFAIGLVTVLFVALALFPLWIGEQGGAYLK